MDQGTLVWRNLRHWSLHIVLSASASFAFAYRTDWSDAPAVVGMSAGVAAFIALYTGVWSSRWFGRRVPPGSAGRRALLYGTRVRSALGVFGLLGVFSDEHSFPFPKATGILFAPDLWTGLWAYSVVLRLGRVPFVRSLRIAAVGDDLVPHPHRGFTNGMNSLLSTFLITMVDGLLLSVFLLAVSWFCRRLIGLYTNFRLTLRPVDTEF